MRHPKEQFRNTLEHVLPWLVLGILLLYTYVKFFEHPYGFSWDTDGKVFDVFVDPPQSLRSGDQLVQVGSLTWDEYQADLRKVFLAGVHKDEIVPVVVERDGQPVSVQWKVPGTNPGELWEQLASEWPVAYFFWLAGTLTLLFLRPKDERWVLLSAFNFLTAIWLEAGGGASNYHLLYSALVLRSAVWLCVPVYLHLHWVFPRPLGKLSPVLVWTAYIIAMGLAVAQWLQWIPSSLYFLGFLIAVLGSVILLIVHAIRQPDVRRELRLLLVTVFFIMVPLIILAVVQSITTVSSRIGAFALLPFPLLPFTYLYAAYRRQLGASEIRVNRLISVYLFIIVIFSLGLPLLAVFYNLFVTDNNFLIVGSIITVLASLFSIWAFPSFQNFVERRLLGITLPGQDLPQVYSARITTSSSLADLLKLLEQDIFPSLLITQYAFVRYTNGSATVLLSKQVTGDQIRDEALTGLLASVRTEQPNPFSAEDRPLGWVHLILPLKLDAELIGAWLLGRRDPDDLYPQAELPILQSLTNQTTIALSNILHSERLRNLYADDIERNEQSRMQLALDLHDTVLNQLAILRLNVDAANLSPKFEDAYNQVTSRLREIVTDLRPPMLMYGLQMAIESLADTLMTRTNTNITLDFQNPNGTRYPENVERHIFRIVQQACENALQHGQATSINIHATLEPRQISLKVEDNGTGFDARDKIDLESLLEQRHFGLAGMLERATFIGGSVEIDSGPGEGARVDVKWQEENSAVASGTR